MLHSRHWWEKQLVGHPEVSVEVERLQGHQHLRSNIRNKSKPLIFVLPMTKAPSLQASHLAHGVSSALFVRLCLKL